MKSLKVYGAPGLLEWNVCLGDSGVRLHLHFAHGSQSPFGASPAEYRTDSKFNQTIIEQSSYFKEGRIVLLDEVVLEGEEESNSPVSSFSESQEQESESQEESLSEEAKKMTFPSVDDAREYAVEKLGVTASSVRSRAALEKALSDAGVVFEIQ